MRLQDKVVIVTGSCTGIGKAIARRCVAEGARVVVHGLERELGEAVVAELGSDRAVLHIEEITAENAPQHLVDLALASFGRLDAIVNNAAMVPSSTIETTDLNLFRQVLDVNTLAPFALIKAALTHLQERRGCVLNIGSVNAWSGEPCLMAYSISKGALLTMTRNLGDSLHRAYGIRVNQINPGWILTEREIERKREQGMPDDWYTSLPAELSPAGRLLMPTEMAAAAVYWLADESGPISGQVVDLEQFPFIGRNLPKN
ncbi:SDR family NAD(P)-dependent oxidoreductase [Spirosoma aerolatum]|uniref:SDR family NAD(P)-dependent oxidoreductase n=1 Tax=Spirosoma aerolatum TaxID=1211326 RepID=UPI0009AD357C|nr:SDR family oxidoreductase [Spirosoma aerolatum]